MEDGVGMNKERATRGPLNGSRRQDRGKKSARIVGEKEGRYVGCGERQCLVQEGQRKGKGFDKIYGRRELNGYRVLSKCKCTQEMLAKWK
jgi:hypothetical protein